MSQSMEKFLLYGKGGEISHCYFSSWASQGISSLLILEELPLSSHMKCQMHRKVDTDNALISG